MPTCSTAGLAFRPGRFSGPAGEQTGQNIFVLNGLLDRPDRYVRLTIKYIGLADPLENHNTPPYASFDSDWQYVTSFPYCPAYFERRHAIPPVFDGLLLYSGLAVAPAPNSAVDRDIKPLKLWAKSYDVSRSYRVPLHRFSSRKAKEVAASPMRAYRPVSKPVNTCSKIARRVTIVYRVHPIDVLVHYGHDASLFKVPPISGELLGGFNRFDNPTLTSSTFKSHGFAGSSKHVAAS